MDEKMDILFEIFTGLPRAGPGSIPGMQTIELAKIIDGKILALDIHQPFLDYILQNAEKEGVSEKIETINQSMLSMEFDKKRFDILWAEGSIFIMTFEKALREWQKFLKEGGYLAVSELVWPSEDPPEDMKTYLNEYPTIQSHEDNLRVIEKTGYKFINSFRLPPQDWATYYEPAEERLKILRKKYGNDEGTLKSLQFMQNEIDLFKKHPQFFIYIFYLMQK